MDRVTSPFRIILRLPIMLALGACAIPVTETAESATAIPEEVMTQLRTLAAPYQDLQSVRLQPEDGCYWYLHLGPVEATMLPLRTVNGRPICTDGGGQV
jgi:hypothetical protein